VAALRLALDHVGDAYRERTLAEVPALAAPVDPELAFLRERYRDSYQTALRDALARLSVKERSVLRLSVVDGLSIDAIGRAYQVHRATAARWVVGAREQLLKETYALLGERLQLRESELRSLATALRSELHLSLGRLL
jgi:RNA polymerase sigma-70 factor (ECF subfamily)